MKVSILYPFVLLSLCSVIYDTNAIKCRPLTDIDAPLWSNWIKHYKKEISIAIEFLNNKKINPNLSKCLASADLSLIELADIYSDQSCAASIVTVMPSFNLDSRNMTISPLYKEIINNFLPFWEITEATFLSIFNKWRNWIYHQESITLTNVCLTIRSKVVPCLENNIIPLLLDKIFDNECCLDFRQDFFINTNYEFNLLTINNVIRDFVNIPCSEQSPGFNQLTQTCQYSFTQAIMDSRFLENIKAAMSIKEETICDAANGKQFKRFPNDEVYQYKKPVGCCINSLDKAFYTLKSLPIVQKLIPNEAFETGKCISANKISFFNDLIDLCPNEFKDMAKKFAEDLCIHIPTDFSKNCKYSTTCSYLSSYIE